MDSGSELKSRLETLEYKAISTDISPSLTGRGKDTLPVTARSVFSGGRSSPDIRHPDKNSKPDKRQVKMEKKTSFNFFTPWAKDILLYC